MRKKATTLIINLSILLVSLIVSVLLLEGGLRLIFPASERGLAEVHEADDELGWRYVADSSQWYTSPGEFRTFVAINSDGLRAEENDSEADEQVLLIGDSFVAAFQVPITQTFAAVAEGILSEGLAPEQANLIPAGFNGYGTDQQLRWYRQTGRSYAADHVILVMYVGNDIIDNDYELASLSISTLPPKPFFLLEDGELVDAGFLASDSDISGDGNASALGVRRWLQRNSYLFSLGSAALTQVEGQPAFQSLLSLLGRTSNDDYNRSYDLFNVAPSAEWERAWAITEALILTMQAEVEADGASFSVMLLPHPVQVHQDWFEARKALYPVMDDMNWEMEQPNQRLALFFADNGIAYLDTLLPLQSYVAESGEYIYFRGDGHFTPEGNQLVGELLGSWLLEGSNKP